MEIPLVFKHISVIHEGHTYASIIGEDVRFMFFGVKDKSSIDVILLYL